MTTFARQNFTQLWLTLRSNEELGLLDADTAATFSKAAGSHVLTTPLGAFGSSLGAGFTYEFWISTTDTSELRAVLGMVDDGSSDAVLFSLNRNRFFSYVPGSIDLFIRDHTGKTLNASASLPGLFDGAWHHVVWTCANPTTNSFALYVDGVPVALTYNNVGSPDTFTDWNYPLVLAGYQLRATGVFWQPDASLDEVAVYSSALSAGRVAAHYAAASLSSGDYAAAVLPDSPVAYWRLSEASGSVAIDRMGAHHGTYVNSPALGVTGALAIVPTYIEDYYGDDGFMTLHHVDTLVEYQMAMLPVPGETPLVDNDVFEGTLPLAGMDLGLYEVRFRVRDPYGNYSISNSVQNPFGGERLLSLTLNIVEQVFGYVYEIGALIARGGYEVNLSRQHDDVNLGRTDSSIVITRPHVYVEIT